MPNTTNFNWPTPADTDLVKDGAAAIRNLGNGVDTSLVDLKGGTTGQILSKASNADMDFTFITPNVGDITEVQAGVGISVASGTGPIPIITNSSTDLITTAGDLLYGTAADTVARLGIGTAGQVLQVNSGATAPQWATPAAGGGFTSLASGSLPASSTLTLSTISGAYKDLRFICKNFQASGQEDVFINVNSSTIIDSVRVVGQGTGSTSTEESTGSANLKVNYHTIETGNNGNIIVIEFKNYAETSGYKAIFSQCRMLSASGGDKINQVNSFGYPRTTSAISEIVFKLSGSAWNGGTYELWGIN